MTTTMKYTSTVNGELWQLQVSPLLIYYLHEFLCWTCCCCCKQCLYTLFIVSSFSFYLLGSLFTSRQSTILRLCLYQYCQQYCWCQNCDDDGGGSPCFSSFPDPCAILACLAQLFCVPSFAFSEFPPFVETKESSDDEDIYGNLKDMAL